jgi:hypothetical protein
LFTGAEESLRSASTRCPGKKEIEEELQRVRVLSAHLAEGERALSGGEPARALEMYAAALKVTQCGEFLFILVWAIGLTSCLFCLQRLSSSDARERRSRSGGATAPCERRRR